MGPRRTQQAGVATARQSTSHTGVAARAVNARGISWSLHHQCTPTAKPSPKRRYKHRYHRLDQTPDAVATAVACSAALSALVGAKCETANGDMITPK